MKTLLKASVVSLAAVAAGPAAAEWPNDKPITFVIPYGPGGGFDTLVRVLAPMLEERVGQSVVPENIPGASGTRGAQTVHRAEPDGYTIGIYNIPGFTVSQAIGTDLGFDLNEVSCIANIVSDRYAIAVAKDSPIQSVEDLCNLGRPILHSDTGIDSTSSITAVIAFSIIGCELTNVTGYSGSNETMIAVMRGEVDATLKPINSLSRYVESGDMRYLVTLSDETLVEGVPTTTEIGYPELSEFGINRVVGGPPGMPQDILDAMGETFLEIAASPEFVEWADGNGTGILALNATETKELMDDLLEFYTEYAPVILSARE
jgi:tripartite-type tricarboxylate transporter receptor subunit TctC